MYHNTLQQFALVTDGAGACHGGRQKTKVTRKKEVEVEVKSQYSDDLKT